MKSISPELQEKIDKALNDLEKHKALCKLKDMPFIDSYGFAMRDAYNEVHNDCTNPVSVIPKEEVSKAILEIEIYLEKKVLSMKTLWTIVYPIAIKHLVDANELWKHIQYERGVWVR